MDEAKKQRSLKSSGRFSPKERMQLPELGELEMMGQWTLHGVEDEAKHTPSTASRGTSLARTTLASRSTRGGRQTLLAPPRRPSEDFMDVAGRRGVHFGDLPPASTGNSGLLSSGSSSRYLKARAQRRIGAFIDGRFMLVVSVAVTIYALVGDDVRLLCTNKPADVYFNAMAILCLIFFTVEIILASIGKPDYFLGFFFGLDLVATCSIVLDLTWISDEMTKAQETNGNEARSGRTARLGATVGRVVRVLRLMRIVKLYRAYFEKVTRKVGGGNVGKKGSSTISLPGEDTLEKDWDNEEELQQAEEAHDEVHHQSRVGKKLVSLTTRRVILLVLVMMLVLPHLSVDMSTVIASSAAWGADSVWQAFVHMEDNATSRPDYEDALLKYVYYHNWFRADAGKCSVALCPHDFLAHPFWMGMAGDRQDVLQSRAELARVHEEALGRWEQVARDSSLLYEVGNLPWEARSLLAAPWKRWCTFGGLDHLGVSLLTPEIEAVKYGVGCPSDLRPGERMRVHPQLITKAQYDNWHFAFFFDLRPFVRTEALFRLLTTGFICVTLCISTLFFSKDANALVLKPVERMVEKVRIIASDPLIAMNIADKEFELEEFQKYKHEKQKKSRLAWLQERWEALSKAVTPARKGKVEALETVILEKTIIKLGSLLALGFGEAGANIVRHNMRGLDTSVVNAMIPGSRVDCIIGNARIRDFALATRVLKEKVMRFVNQIAEIVHGIVNEYQGAPNKNMGDTFLIIWRSAGLDDQLRTRLADMSIISFARILGCVHESPVLARYRKHPGFQQALGSQCRVNLSFGLHSGWAIEGGVGTEFKIDASYLSPNVSITASLEHATRIYDVNIVISEAVIQQCSQVLAQKCRLIDKVIIKGSLEPLELYVLDLDASMLSVVVHEVPIPWNTRQRFRARQLLEIEKREKWDENCSLIELFDCNAQVAAMRSRYTEEFLQVFKMGYRNYEEGEWETARRYLTKTLDMLGIRDGPSGELLRFMGSKYDFEAPATWGGVHKLEGHERVGGA